MTDVYEEPPDENEQYENLDESLDEQDLPGHGGGPDGARDLDLDVVADVKALAEVGANLDDPDQMSLLDGAMDDPDGVRPGRTSDEEDADIDAGWGSESPSRDRDLDLGPGPSRDAEVPAPGDEAAIMARHEDEDPELAITGTDPADLEQIPDDAPGPDSVSW